MVKDSRGERKIETNIAENAQILAIILKQMDVCNPRQSALAFIYHLPADVDSVYFPEHLSERSCDPSDATSKVQDSHILGGIFPGRC